VVCNDDGDDDGDNDDDRCYESDHDNGRDGGGDDVSLWYNCGLTMIINGMVLFRWRFL